MRILFLPKYGKKAASSRYRFYQYFPYLAGKGVTCDVSPLFDDLYLRKKLDLNESVVGDAVRAFSRRFGAVASKRQYDLVVIHCEAFPYFPSIFENFLFKRGIKYVYDYDDAIFHQYDQHANALVKFFFKNKIKDVISKAELVVAGSPYLAEYARKFNPRVEILPTVVDLNKYRVRQMHNVSDQQFTIGWIGSPSTAPYVKLIEPALIQACREKVRLVMVGAGKSDLSGFPYEIKMWSEETEITDIHSFDVGIMPLSDTPWDRGKCGFKLIQYMACGLPVIASPVGVNKDIVEHGVNGFLAETTEEWIRALRTLRENPEMRRAMGKAGREKVERQYCLRVTAPKLVELLKEAAGK
jgi:glycosyltransferase involved in cell wall biosynthesis